jgi:hypothetical protein
MVIAHNISMLQQTLSNIYKSINMVKKSYNVESRKYENVPFSYPNQFRKLHHFEPLATCLARYIRLNDKKITGRENLPVIQNQIIMI